MSTPPTPRTPRPPAPGPAQLAAAAAQLRRRPPAALEDLTGGRLPSPAERALRRIAQLYPAVAAHVDRAILLAAAHPQPPAGCCRWGVARLTRQVHPGGRRLRLGDPALQALLGPACPACRAALTPKPKPKPNMRSRATPAGSSASTRRWRPPSASQAELARFGHLIASAATRPDADRARYNRAAMRRLGMDPATAPHLTGGGR
jgi:hypothetical protein